MEDRKFCNIWGGSVIGQGTRIGEYVEIGGAVVGDNCSIQAFCYICPGTVLEDNVFLGPRVTTTNDKYPPSNREEWSGVTVREGASVGAGAILMPGVTIGRNARIGAGSVVTQDVPDGETWAGNPATPDFRQPVLRHEAEKAA